MPRTRLHAPEAQPVTFVELFFDLVFVFAVTQVTVLTVEHLDLSGVARSAVVFWLIWWAWTQLTWTLSPADTQATAVRALTLAATAAAFVMAASVPRAFGDDVLWFALPYLVIRVLGMGLQVRVDREAADGATGISMRWVSLSLIGLGLVILGTAVDPDVRAWVWLLAIVADLVAAALAASDAEWDLDAAHFSERHGLFVIIALGESLIVAGTAVAGDDRGTDLVLAAGAALLVVCLLWWTYFGWLKDAIEHHVAAAPSSELGPLARDAYSLLHFALVGGIISLSAAVKELVFHPEDPLPPGGRVALTLGLVLFLGATAAAWRRAGGGVLWARIVGGLVLGTVTATATVAPGVEVVLVVAGLALVIAVEHWMIGRSTAVQAGSPAA
jgi:low temperature requirement protein LtrA